MSIHRWTDKMLKIWNIWKWRSIFSNKSNEIVLSAVTGWAYLQSEDKIKHHILTHIHGIWKLVQMNLSAGQERMQKQRTNMWTWGRAGWAEPAAWCCHVYTAICKSTAPGSCPPAQGAPCHALGGLGCVWSGGLEGRLQREGTDVYFLHTAVQQGLPQRWTNYTPIKCKFQKTFMKKLKTGLSHESATALCAYPEKTTTGKDTRSTVFTAALFTTARTWKQREWPPQTNGWEGAVRTHVEHYSAIKRKGVGSFVDMDGTRVCCTEWSNKSENQTLYINTYGI